MNHLGKPSFVSFNGVNLTDYVQAVTLAAEQAGDNMLEFAELYEPIRLTMRTKVSPYGYKALFGRTHPRISRMHTAYGRRRRSW